MKIVGICASPRKGNSELALKILLDSTKQKGAEINLVLLRNFNIGFVGTKKKDDFDKKILPRIVGADALIFASPVYYDMVSPQLLNLIDRLDPHANLMKNKNLGVILCGTASFRSSGKNAVDYLERVAEIYNMKFIGYVFGRVEKAGEIAKDKNTISKLRKFGAKLVK